MKHHRIVQLTALLLLLSSAVASAAGSGMAISPAQLVFSPLPNCGGDLVDSKYLRMSVEPWEKRLQLTAQLIDTSLWDERIALKVNKAETFVTLSKEPAVVVSNVDGTAAPEINLSVLSLADRGTYWGKVLWRLVDADGAEKATAVTAITVETP